MKFRFTAFIALIYASIAISAQTNRPEWANELLNNTPQSTSDHNENLSPDAQKPNSAGNNAQITPLNNDELRNLAFISTGGEKIINLNYRGWSGWKVIGKTPEWIKAKIDKSTQKLQVDVVANNDSISRNAILTIEAEHKFVGDDGKQNKVKEQFDIKIAQSCRAIFKIKDIEFANMRDDNSIIFDYGEPFTAREMRYLATRVIYDGAETPENGKLTLRIIGPTGKVLKSVNDNGDVTIEKNVSFKPGANNALLLKWGNKLESLFPMGTYTCELYNDDQLVVAKTFKVTRSKDQKMVVIEDMKIEQNADDANSTGIMLHTRLHTYGLKDEPIYLCAFIYQQDGTTPLRKIDGSRVVYQDVDTPIYDDSIFNDWQIFIPYADLRKLGAKKPKVIIHVINKDKTSSYVKTEPQSLYF